MRNALLGLALLLGGGTAAAFEQTVIPCGVNGNVTSSCTVTASTQMITLSKSTTTTSATITSSLAARRVNRVVVPAVKEKYWVAPYQDIGPLAIRDYDGSGMCGKCDPSYNDQYYQTVSIVECSSNARQSTKVCRRYAETWARTAEGHAAPCTITATTRYPAPSAGTYTFTFYGTAPPTYTVYPPTITSSVGRNGKTTYKVGKPTTVWYQPQPYNVELTTIVNNGGIINFYTTINTIISVYLPTTTITATSTVTFTSTVGATTTSSRRSSTTTSSRRSTTTTRSTTSTRVSTTSTRASTSRSTSSTRVSSSSTSTRPSVPSSTPQQFYIEALDSTTNEYFYIRFVNNQAQIVTDQDAIANGADTFNLTYGFLQNLKTAQGGGFGNGGTFLVGTSGTDGTYPIYQYGGFPSGSAQWDLFSLPGNYGPGVSGDSPGYYISGLTLRGAQSFCADAQNNVYSVFSTRSSSCVRTITFAVVRGVRGAPTSATSTSRMMSTSMSTSSVVPTSTASSVSTTSSAPSTTTSPSGPFYIEAINSNDGTIRYIRFSGPYAYLISASEALGGDNTPDDTEPSADLFDVDEESLLRSYYGGYIGTPNTNNGAPMTRYNRRPTQVTTFVVNPDGTLTLNGASSYCTNSNGQLLTNYGGSQAASCTSSYRLYAVSRVTRSPANTTSTTSATPPSSTTLINTSGSSSVPSSMSTRSSTTMSSMMSTTSSVSTTSPTPSTFYLRARSVNGGPPGYLKFSGQNAYLISPSQAYGNASDGSAPAADLFYRDPDGSLRNGPFYVGTTSNTTGEPLQRYSAPATGSSKYTMNPDGTMTMDGSTSFCADDTGELFVNYNGEVSPQCQYQYLISPVEFVDPNDDTTTSSISTSQTVLPTSSSMVSSSMSGTSQTVLPTSSTVVSSSTSGTASFGSSSTSTSSASNSGSSSSTPGLSSTTTPLSSLTTISTSSATPTTTVTPINQPFYIRAYNPATGSVRYLKFVGDQVTLITSSQALNGSAPGSGSPSGADQFTISGGNNSTGSNGITGTLFSGPYLVGPSSLTDGAPLRRYQNGTLTSGSWNLAPDGTLTLNGASSFYIDSASDLLVSYSGASQDCNTFVLSAASTVPDDSASTTSSSLCPATVSATSSTSTVSTSFTNSASTTASVSTTLSTSAANPVSSTTSLSATTSGSATSLVTTSGLSTTTSPIASPTPFYIYAVDPTTGEKRYLRRAGNLLIPINPNNDTPDQYLIDATGYMEDVPVSGANSTSPYYISFTNTNTSSPFEASPNQPTSPMGFTVGPDGQITMDNATSYCYTSSGGIIANFNGNQDASCQTPVQLFRTYTVDRSTSPTTSATSTGPVATTSSSISTSGSSVATTSGGISTSGTSIITTSASVSTSGGLTSSTSGTGATTCPAGCTTTVTLPPVTTTVIVTAGGPTAGTTGTDGYVTITVTSGQTGTTTTSVTASGTTQGTVVVVFPTPAQCGNLGVQYAIQSNPYVKGSSTSDPTYAAFMARAFQTERPQATGVTNYLEIPFQSRDSSASIYGVAVGPGAAGLGVNHRGYFFAKMTGIYTFTFPSADDIALLWLGSDAYGPTYARGNADIDQTYGGDASTFSSQQVQLRIPMNQGSYYAMRALWANYRDDAQFLLQITAPDGEVLTNGTSGPNPSPYLVQYSCDGTTAPMWSQAFGQEGSVQRVRGRR